MNELAGRIIAATGSKSGIQHVSYEDAYAPGFEDMERRVPHISKACCKPSDTIRHTLSLTF